jgi:hypothetical protein
MRKLKLSSCFLFFLEKTMKKHSFRLALIALASRAPPQTCSEEEYINGGGSGDVVGLASA